MRKFLLLCSIFVATSVWAFGGIGIGPWQRHKNQGVDAIGIHIDLNGKKADIDIVDGDSDACPAGGIKHRFGKCNICENGNVYLSYMDDPCGTDISISGNCTSNKDCEADEFCDLGSGSEISLYPDSGTCTTIGNYKDVNVDNFGTVRIPEGVVQRQFWGAQNWCKAQGKSLIDIEALGCYPSGSTEKIVPMSNYYAGCCQAGQTCAPEAHTWHNQEGFNNVLKVLYPALESDDVHLWLNTRHTDHCEEDGCLFTTIQFFDGILVGLEPWEASDSLPLCK